MWSRSGRQARIWGRAGWIALALAAAPAFAAPAAGSGTFTSLAEAFDRFATESARQYAPDRVTRFGREVGPRLPDFYRPGASGAAAFERRVTDALDGYPQIRERFLWAAASIELRHRSAIARFGRFFPGYRTTLPVYVIHSLGELDGGTRIIDGQVTLVFGADVIARLHDETTIGPLIDHEIFHGYHRPLFGECDAIWCGLWVEGLATYVASRLNPGVGDRALLLEFPQPIRPALEERADEAVCLTLARLDSTAPEDLRGFFAGNGSMAGMPSRFGYFIGFRVAAQLGERRSLDALARLDRAAARREVEAVLRSMATCAESE